MKTSERGLNLIKKYEGCRLTAYQCPAGVWTIGYGHTGTVNGKAICRGMKITQKQAVELLQKDLTTFENSVRTAVTAKINQKMFDALVSFTYNCGAGALRNSTLLKKLNAEDYDCAAAQFLKWNKANGKVLAGLTARRKEESELFLDGLNELQERLVNYKVSSSVNYRSEPYIDVKTWRGKLYKGQVVQVVWGSGKSDKNGVIWVKIKIDGEYYYVYKRALVAI